MSFHLDLSRVLLLDVRFCFRVTLDVDRTSFQLAVLYNEITDSENRFFSTNIVWKAAGQTVQLLLLLQLRRRRWRSACLPSTSVNCSFCENIYRSLRRCRPASNPTSFPPQKYFLKSSFENCSYLNKQCSLVKKQPQSYSSNALYLNLMLESTRC